MQEQLSERALRAYQEQQERCECELLRGLNEDAEALRKLLLETFDDEHFTLQVDDRVGDHRAPVAHYNGDLRFTIRRCDNYGEDIDTSEPREWDELRGVGRCPLCNAECVSGAVTGLAFLGELLTEFRPEFTHACAKPL
jgi:hypothetical protein